MDADEQEIVNYLSAFPRQFVSNREISRRAAGKQRFREDPYWATQILIRLTEKGILETDAAGHYRMKQDDKKEKEERRKRWISPQIEQLLKESGKDFDGLIEPDRSGEDKSL